MQFIACSGHGHAANDLRIARGPRVDVNDGQAVRALALGIELGHVGVFLGWSLGRQAGGRIERWVRRESRHLEGPPKVVGTHTLFAPRTLGSRKTRTLDHSG